MKRRISILLLAAVLLGSVPAAAQYDGDVSAYSSILIHADTGTVLYESNADQQMLIASVTKILTAIVVLENAALDEKVNVTYEHTCVEGSSMYLQTDREYTVLDLLYGMMLVSGNDASAALADHVAGSMDGFAELMNKKAAVIGMTSSSFKNSHGLDADGHYSTARDLATLMAYAMENEKFCEITSTKSYTLYDQTYSNHNKLLWNCDGTVGGKTGYTKASGRTLVSCAERDGMRLVCVTLGAPDDWNDHASLYDWGFDNYTCVSVLAGQVLCRLPVLAGEAGEVAIAAGEDIELLVAKDTDVSVSYELPNFVFAGVKKGENAGRLTVCSDGELLASSKLVYLHSVAIKDGEALTKWEKIKRAWYISNRYSYIYYGQWG